jgi:agmatine deiminase
LITVLLMIVMMTGCALPSNAMEETFYFPAEDEKHEGTWLTWPHNKTYGYSTRKDLEPVWIAMTEALSSSENVHIIAYDKKEKNHIDSVLRDSETDMSRVDYYLFPTDDSWIRDNGPIFLRDSTGELIISNWQFNGWGEKCPYKKDDKIPTLVGKSLGIKTVNIDMVLEGGSVESDGRGTCIATLSSIVNPNRNPGLTIDKIESYLSQYMGFTNFIWLEGVVGLDITDFHIDGFVKMIDETRILTMSKNDLIEDWGLSEDDYQILSNSVNSEGRPYDFTVVPLTAKNVVGVNYKGSYLNYYIANTVVLVPNYNDSNDSIANNLISDFYPDKEIVGIDVSKLYLLGGMIHCVTQQQPEM